jgi:hypothetical protein
MKTTYMLRVIWQDSTEVISVEDWRMCIWDIDIKQGTTRVRGPVFNAHGMHQVGSTNYGVIVSTCFPFSSLAPLTPRTKTSSSQMP